MEDEETIRLIAIALRLLTEKEGTACGNSAGVDSYLKKNGTVLVPKKLPKTIKPLTLPQMVFDQYEVMLFGVYIVIV